VKEPSEKKFSVPWLTSETSTDVAPF